MIFIYNMYIIGSKPRAHYMNTTLIASCSRGARAPAIKIQNNIPLSTINKIPHVKFWNIATPPLF